MVEAVKPDWEPIGCHNFDQSGTNQTATISAMTHGPNEE